MEELRKTIHHIEHHPIPSHNWALFLDIDGTLTDIKSLPEQVRISAFILTKLKSLASLLEGALAIVSGRNLRSIDQLISPFAFAAAGQHGLEIRDVKGYVQRLDENREIIDLLAEKIAAFHLRHPGIHIEYKGLSIALHYRLAPFLEHVIRAYVMELVAPYEQKVIVREGKKVIELQLKQASKAVAIYRFMEKAPFKGRTPVFVGDDNTDEDGFIAVNNMNGFSFKVGPGQTEANYRFSNVAEVEAWLASIIQHLSNSIKGEQI